MERAAEATVAGSASVGAAPRQMLPDEVTLRTPRRLSGKADEAAAREVKLALNDLLQLADCGLQVHQGVVYLAGRVQRRSQVHDLARRLDRVPGVHRVQSVIQFDIDDTGRRPPPARKQRRLRDEKE